MKDFGRWFDDQKAADVVDATVPDSVAISGKIITTSLASAIFAEKLKLKFVDRSSLDHDDKYSHMPLVTYTNILCHSCHRIFGIDLPTEEEKRRTLCDECTKKFGGYVK